MIGIDEVGRGPLAGPVVVGGVRMITDIPVTVFFPKGVIRDSKKLSSLQRKKIIEIVETEVIKGTLLYALGLRTAHEVDTDGIVASIRGCSDDVLAKLDVKPDELILSDAGLAIPEQYTQVVSMVRGDSEVLAIALASIIAKEYRDNEMTEMDTLHPAYGFKDHAGYGTAKHIQAIKEHGFCREHRTTFLRNIVVG